MDFLNLSPGGALASADKDTTLATSQEWKPSSESDEFPFVGQPRDEGTMLTLKPMLVSGSSTSTSTSIQIWETVDADGVRRVEKTSMLTNSHRLLHLCQLCLIHSCGCGEVRLEKTVLACCLAGNFLMNKS